MNTTSRKPITPELLFPNMYLKAEDLGGKTATVAIADILVEKAQRAGGGKKKKAVDREFEATLHFAGKKKRMMLNATNMWSILLLLAPPGGRDINIAIGKRIVIGSDMDVNLQDGGDSPCLRVIGSPDAAPDRVTLFNRAWQGKRTRGDLVARTKLAMTRLGAVITANVPAPDEPAPEASTPPPGEDFDEQWGDDDGKAPVSSAPPVQAKPAPLIVGQLESMVAHWCTTLADCTGKAEFRAIIELMHAEHPDVRLHATVTSALDAARERVNRGG